MYPFDSCARSKTDLNYAANPTRHCDGYSDPDVLLAVLAQSLIGVPACGADGNLGSRVAEGELALAHVNSDTLKAAHRRSDLFEKRRELMTEWAACIAAPPE